MIPFTIAPLQDSDRPWLRQFWIEHWGAPVMVSRGQLKHVDHLPGFIARKADDNQPLGLVTYHIAPTPASQPRRDGPECELVSLDSLVEGQGVGTALIEAVRQAASESGCHRLWLMTTNDNLPALGFYQRRGFRLVAVHAGVVEQSRRIKPSIPLIGLGGVPLRDEIELELPLEVAFPPSAATQVFPPDPSGNPAGTRLARRPIYESAWVNLYLDHMRTPSGQEITDYHIVDYPTAAVAAYVTNAQGEVLMGRYYRYAIGKLRWEVPAGGIDRGEDIIEAARREVLEETGYESHGYTQFARFFPAAGSGNKVFYLARGFAGERTGLHDPNELADVAWFPIPEIRAMIQGGEVDDGYTLIAMLLAWELGL